MAAGPLIEPGPAAIPLQFRPTHDPGGHSVEPVIFVVAVAIGIVRALAGRRNRKATATVARALDGVGGRRSDAHFARYPKGRWGR